MSNEYKDWIIDRAFDAQYLLYQEREIVHSVFKKTAFEQIQFSCDDWLTRADIFISENKERLEAYKERNYNSNLYDKVGDVESIVCMGYDLFEYLIENGVDKEIINLAIKGKEEVLKFYSEDVIKEIIQQDMGFDDYIG